MPFAKINGKQLHYTDTSPTAGSTPALTVVLVHGLGSTQNYFHAVLPYLTEYRCITFDNYGAGRSKYDPESHPETSVGAIGKDVLGLMDYLSVDKAVVVGFSMSGMVPTHLAADAEGTSRVIAGVCIGPVHPTSAGADVFKQRIATVKDGGMEPLANTVPNAATGPKTAAVQKALIREMLLAQDPEGYIANCRAVANATPPAYDRVKCPILIIAGEVDKSAPLDGCKHIFEHLATDKKKLEVLDGTGHWICVEEPDRAGRLIESFLHTL